MLPDNTAVDDYLNTQQPDAAEYPAFTLDLDDNELQNMLVGQLEENIAHWNKKPWNLEETDKHNINYLLGENEQQLTVIIDGEEFVNNRLFTAVRATLSYATGQLATPEIGPKSNDPVDKKAAQALALGLYEHGMAEDADDLFRVSLLALLTRKRAYLKMRYDEDAGVDGDIVTEFCNPEDIIIDRYARYKKDPNIIYHRCRCTVDELVSLFPDKQAAIYGHFNIKRGVYTQMSQMVTYFEAWFTFMENGQKQQGVAWFLPNANFMLDKMRNPNWIYKGSWKNQKKTNYLNQPPKPFVKFSYFNMGKSPIDETCLFDQAVPLQKLINKRIKQISDNADYVNGRWVYNKKAVDDPDAKKFTMAKSTNSALGVTSEDVNKAIVNISSAVLPAYIYQSLIDARNELDTVMGTPSQFRGEGSDSQNTLGKDEMIKQQAGMLQDDLVRATTKSAKEYYKLKMHMMKVYYNEDHMFSQKSGSGDYVFVNLNDSTIDTNAKVSIEIDSTLPLDRSAIRRNSIQLAEMQRIDNLTLFEDLGLPDAEMRVERLIRSQISPLGFMESMQTIQDNNDAELDITLVMGGKTPEERSIYDESYLSYWNNFMTTNRFGMLPQQTKQRLVVFLQFVQQKAAQMAQLQQTQQAAPPQVDDAGLLPFQAPPIIPKVSITGALSQADSAQMARLDPSQDPQIPADDQIAQNPNGRIAAQPGGEPQKPNIP